MHRPHPFVEGPHMSAATTNSKSIIAARKKLTRATETDRQLAARPQIVDEEKRKAEEYANLQANIPFGFLFLNRH